MLRIHFLQQGYVLSDPGVDEARYDSAAMRRFAGIDLGREGAPDETTGCKFRHLLEQHDWADQLFATDPKRRELTEQLEHAKASIRAAVEPPFRVLKRQFGYVKVRYQGLAKNGAQGKTRLARVNLWKARRRWLQAA